MILLCTLSIPVRGLYSCDVFHHCPSSVFRKLLVISFKNLNNGKVMTDQITAALLLTTLGFEAFFFNLDISMNWTIATTLQMLKFYSVVIPCNNSLVTLAVENHSINKTTSKHPYFTIMPWKSGQLFSQKCWTAPHTFKWANNMHSFRDAFLLWTVLTEKNYYIIALLVLNTYKLYYTTTNYIVVITYKIKMRISLPNISLACQVLIKCHDLRGCSCGSCNFWQLLNHRNCCDNL